MENNDLPDLGPFNNPQEENIGDGRHIGPNRIRYIQETLGEGDQPRHPVRLLTLRLRRFRLVAGNRYYLFRNPFRQVRPPHLPPLGAEAPILRPRAFPRMLLPQVPAFHVLPPISRRNLNLHQRLQPAAVEPAPPLIEEYNQIGLLRVEADPPIVPRPPSPDPVQEEEESEEDNVEGREVEASFPEPLPALRCHSTESPASPNMQDETLRTKEDTNQYNPTPAYRPRTRKRCREEDESEDDKKAKKRLRMDQASNDEEDPQPEPSNGTGHVGSHISHFNFNPTPASHPQTKNRCCEEVESEDDKSNEKKEKKSLRVDQASNDEEDPQPGPSNGTGHVGSHISHFDFNPTPASQTQTKNRCCKEDESEDDKDNEKKEKKRLCVDHASSDKDDSLTGPSGYFGCHRSVLSPSNTLSDSD